ncbi:tRNA pseudouridine 13 synthase [hydrothermal vent metagenome]|uniref:tRNA pseudouridine 13 synthase n=1 Tax=hydrothermal vent metagenome TaxID=652676 RepID=A0A3B1DS72_9ZZZZ
MTKQYFFNHSKIDVYFKPNHNDFVVTEVPLYQFSGDGEHLVVTIRKKDLSTWDMIAIISDYIGCKSRDIGYAGLKDKNAMTIQFISIPKIYETKIDEFKHTNIKIIDKTYHNNKIRVGHLKGNKFFIRLKRVSSHNSKIIKSVLEQIITFGMPNYFGYQRFGINGDNYLKGQDIISGKLQERNKKLKQMYINSFQSFIFNNWLSKRIEISKLINNFEISEIYKKLNMTENEVRVLKQQKHPFKILLGDVMSHYPFGRIFHAQDLVSEADKFNLRDRVPTGLLCGKKTKIAIYNAREIELLYDEKTTQNGSRRFAWIFPSDIESNFKEENNWLELKFTLPKGSYATELISELIH